MSSSIELTDHFKKEAKKLSKKYRSLKTKLESLGNKLAENPTSGTPQLGVVSFPTARPKPNTVLKTVFLRLVLPFYPFHFAIGNGRNYP